MGGKGKIENLKPFKKGVDPRRNTKGPSPILPDLKEAIDKVFGEEKDGITALEMALRQLRMKATKGDLKAIEILLDRRYGKAHQSISADVRAEIVTIDMEGVDNADQG